MRRTLGAVVTTAALMITTPLIAAAQSTRVQPDAIETARSQPRVTVVNRQVVAPFSLAVSRGRVFVADGGTGKVSRLVDGSLRTIVTGPHTSGGDVAGLDVSRDGRYLAYTATTSEAHTTTYLEIRGPLGHRVRADLSGYEARVNPDRTKRYGILDPSPCVADYFAKHRAELGPVNYRGQVDSHPYAVASVDRHWIVADAGGNDLLRVDSSGRVSTLTVLPSQPFRITAAAATTLHLPSCAVGATYYAESVPTDVEQGRDGSLYVTTLAGGAESPALGARSKVYRVNPRTGRTTQVGSHLSGATNLALRHGKIYVTELFAGRISVLEHGRPHTYVKLAGALSVESGARGLWAGTMGPMDRQGRPTGPGTIVRITG